MFLFHTGISFRSTLTRRNSAPMQTCTQTRNYLDMVCGDPVGEPGESSVCWYG